MQTFSTMGADCQSREARSVRDRINNFVNEVPCADWNIAPMAG